MLRIRRIGGLAALFSACSLGVPAVLAEELQTMQVGEIEEVVETGAVKRISFPPGAGGGISGATCLQPGSNCQLPNQANGLNSTTTLFRVADNFDPTTSGNLTSVCWWGMYANGGNDCGATAVDAFTIRILNDNNGIPGTLVASFTQGTNLTVTRGTTGTTLPFGTGLAEYEYSATLSGTPANLNASLCYWIEIQNAVTGCTWFWETGTNAAATYPDSVQDGDNAYALADFNSIDMAFCVSNGVDNSSAEPCAPNVPANDECASATVIATTGVQTIVDLRSATDNGTDPPFSCYAVNPPANGSGSIWFRFTASLTSHRINTCNSPGNDSVFAVYSGTCGSLTEIACNDDACGLLSDVIVSGLTVGNTYFIQLAAFDATQKGVYTLEVGPPLSCQDHLPTGGYILVPSNNGATPIWEDFNLAAGANISRLETTGIYWSGGGGATCNTVPADTADAFAVEFWSQGPDGLPAVLLATRNEGDGTLASTRTPTGLQFGLLGGVCGPVPLQRHVITFTPPVTLPSAGCYWFRVVNVLTGQPVQWWWLGGPRSVMDAGNGRAGWDGGNNGLQLGDVVSYDWIWCMDSLDIVDPTSCSDTSPPVNDECSGALVLPCNPNGETRTIDLRYATPSGADPTPSCVGAPLESSVWFSVTTGSSNPSLLIQTCDTNFVGVNDSAVAVFTAGPGGCPSDLVEVACANDNCGGAFYEQIRIDPALPNTQYFIMVGGVDVFAQLFYELEVTCPAPPRPANDACAAAVALNIGFPTAGTTSQASVDANISGLTPCNAVASDEVGVWYTVVNPDPDTLLEASLCSVATTAEDPVLTIWCGADCGSLQCVTGNDDGCGPGSLNSSVQWCAKQGATYYIHVSKFPGSTEGAFEIVVNLIGGSCAPDPASCPVAPSCAGDRGDANCDGSVDFFDIDPFLLSLFNQAQYLATFCGGSLCAADTDCSGGVDFFDIDPFLNCLFMNCTPVPPACQP